MQICLTNQTVKLLNKMYKTALHHSGLLLLRIQGIFALSAGASCVQVANRLSVSVRAVERWRVLFLTKGATGLLVGKAKGAESKLNATEKQMLYQLIVAGPQASGYASGCWRSPMIVELIAKCFGVSYHPNYVSRLLGSMGLSWQKAGFDAAGKDPQARKQWIEDRWPAIVEKAKKLNAHILFVDEVSFPQWGSLSYTWAPRGQQPVVKTSGVRKAAKVFGAISYNTGAFYTKIHEGRFNSESYQAFLLEVFSALKRHIILIQDGAKYHISKAMKAFYKKYENRLTVEQLPSYSPDYNPIERVWKEIKKERTHLKFFPDFDTLMNTVKQAMIDFSLRKEKIVHLCSMYKRLERQIA